MLCSYQNKIKLLTFIMLILSIGLCQQKEEKSFDPVVKSLLLPGWGQQDLGFNKRSRIYNYLEAGILISIVVTSKYSNEIKRNYIAFASEHASVNSLGKDHEFWVDIGNYNSRFEYNDEHLRNRESNDLYPQGNDWFWNWDTIKNRNSFESKRILSDNLKLVSTFAIGGLIMNHAISSIDALYLKRKLKKNKLTIIPFIKDDVVTVGYNIVYKF
jgi:hypothetical protein|tara:strand:- start:6 stop:647 length:642 start_codon:yes stop_codon:yes gene_type:complete